MPALVGDLEALKLLDLDAAGLGEYKTFVSQILPKYASSKQPVKPATTPLKAYKRAVSNSNAAAAAYAQANMNAKVANKLFKHQVQASGTGGGSNQSMLNYYQNPQFLTSTASLAAQSKSNPAGNYANFDNTFLNGNNPGFNSVYLSGY